MRISYWSSDVCSSVLALAREGGQVHDGDVRLGPRRAGPVEHLAVHVLAEHIHGVGHLQQPCAPHLRQRGVAGALAQRVAHIAREHRASVRRSEEHTSELQSLMRISYAVFCLKKKKTNIIKKKNKRVVI